MTLFKKVWEFVVWVIEEFKERVREGILSIRGRESRVILKKGVSKDKARIMWAKTQMKGASARNLFGQEVLDPP